MLKIIKTLRTAKTMAEYESRIEKGTLPKCHFCEAKPIKEYKHWIIVNNDFPYDEVAETSHIISPKRHVTENELTKEELEEYKKIKIETQQEYDLLLENSIKLKSIPKHHHLHLLKLKERIVEIEPGLTASFFSQKNKMSQTKSVAG